jgi:peptidoglycan hydrolase-like protein with peptidoglycan-binding domain
MPYLDGLAAQCGLATNYHSTTHNSVPNYLALTSGLSLSSLQPFTGDCLPSSCSTPAPSIFQQTFAKSYQESMPSNCYKSNNGTYAPKHNPDLYYRNDPNCATRDVPIVGNISGGSVCPVPIKAPASGGEVMTLQADLNKYGWGPVTVNSNFDAATTSSVNKLKSSHGWTVDGVAGDRVWGALGECSSSSATGLFADFQSASTAPAYSFVTPNLCNDGHDCSLSTADNWIKTVVSQLVASPVYLSGATAIFIVFDEGEPASAGENCAANVGDQSCHVELVVVAPSVKPGTRAAGSFNHYSLLRASEDLLGLSRLGQAASAPSLLPSFNL